MSISTWMDKEDVVCVYQIYYKGSHPEYSLERLMLKRQYCDHLMRTYSLEMTPMLGKIEGRRESWCQKMRWLDGITDSMEPVQSLGWEDSLEKEMTAHSNILAWRIPWTEEPGGLQSMGSQRVGHDWVINAHQPPPPPPGDNEGQRSLASCSSWAAKSRTWLSD